MTHRYLQIRQKVKNIRHDDENINNSLLTIFISAYKGANITKIITKLYKSPL